ncbi:MFS transporter [Microbacterium sp. YMB-B2]|uniref:MFS transporter n=1 Tax=Microbacterium tenebrionis TaxID=2830665 RepID=A0A9X1S040_9MICO|nr:MFS transporter [Microbacterium tenebrionis]MCC2028875.1 MFS transporter [Microbacterium tenebrionis]
MTHNGQSISGSATSVRSDEPASGDAPSRQRLTWGTRLSYGLGDLASQLVWTTTGSYLAIFYTDAVGLSAGAVGVLMLIARVFDAAIDPGIGAAAERTRSRFGRFRSWIIYGSPILAILLVLSFSTIPGSDGAKFLYAIVTYGLLGIAYSAVNVPYGSLVSVMTTDTQERVTLNSIRLIGTNVGVVLLNVITLPLILFFSGLTGGVGDEMTIAGYTWTAAVMAAIALPLFLITAFKSKEVVQPIHSTRVSLRTTARIVFGNRLLMLIFAIMMLAMTGFFGRLGVVIYYFIYAVGRVDLIPVLMATPAVAGVIGILLFTPLTRRFGKRAVAIVSLVAQGLSLVALYLVGWEDVTLVIVISAIYGLASFNAPIFWSMVPDAIDYAEDKHGVRADGTAYAVISFAQKIAAAVGVAIGLAALGAIGYVANTAQAPEVLSGMNVIVNLAPAILCFAAIIPLSFYRLSARQYDEIRARLDTAALRTLRKG